MTYGEVLSVFTNNVTSQLYHTIISKMGSRTNKILNLALENNSAVAGSSGNEVDNSKNFDFDNVFGEETKHGGVVNPGKHNRCESTGSRISLSRSSSSSSSRSSSSSTKSISSF
uniref:Bromodomain-containing protein DDB_G0271118-like n=1 Tax=Diabrotica virgifera virgifera TaxID=50390 RepID=A0A6P7FY50_DIAVI